MPYLKIKVADNGDSNDWITINNLNLSTLSVSGNATISGNTTINGNTTIGDANTDTLTINANVKKFKSTKTENGQTQSVEISDGELKIQSPGKAVLSLGDYLNLNTSGCTVGSSSGEEPGNYGWTAAGKTPKRGDLFIQQRTDGYSLLWYYDNTTWKRVHAIWG